MFLFSVIHLNILYTCAPSVNLRISTLGHEKLALSCNRFYIISEQDPIHLHIPTMKSYSDHGPVSGWPVLLGRDPLAVD